MKRRRIDPRRAKLHRNYSVEEAARLFGTHRNTVRAWLRAGLSAIDGPWPILILGSELRRFLNERRARLKRPTPAGMISAFLSRTASSGGEHGGLSSSHGHERDLQNICPDCSTLLYRRVNLALCRLFSRVST